MRNEKCKHSLEGIISFIATRKDDLLYLSSSMIESLETHMEN